MCNNCLQYGYPKKYCKRTEPKCRKCSSSGHGMTECTVTLHTLCLHCSEAHNPGSRECSRHQKEEAIMQVQEEEKITILRAKQILERTNEFVEKPT